MNALKLEDGETEVVFSKRKADGEISALLLFSVAVLVFLAIYTQDFWARWALIAAAVFFTGYFCWIHVAAGREWAAVTSKRVVVCKMTLRGMREKSYPLEGIKSWRVVVSARAARAGSVKGDIVLYLKKGHHGTVPFLKKQQEFLNALEAASTPGEDKSSEQGGTE